MKKTLPGIALLAVFIACSCSKQNEIIMIEAEHFDHPGGWVCDAAYMDEMGSPYLMAHGLGFPVEDAYTTVRFPEAGLWHLYIRTYNWVAPWKVSPAPGLFKVAIDGAISDTLFGKEPDHWGWKYGGTFEAGDKAMEIRLLDQTGFNGRVDAVLFSRSEMKALPDGGEQLHQLRIEGGSISGSLKQEGTYDLVVAGEGLAAASAAIAATRSGLTVALLWEGEVPDFSRELEEYEAAKQKESDKPYNMLGLVLDELIAVKDADEYEEMHAKEKYLAFLESQDGLEVFTSCHITGVNVEEKRITSLETYISTTGESLLFEGLLFTDCTRNSRLGELAGAETLYGKELKKKDKLPEDCKLITMGQLLNWTAMRVEDSVAFPACSWGLSFNQDTYLPGSHSGKKWASGFYLPRENNKEQVRDYLLRALFGNWAFLKQHEAAEYSCFTLEDVAYTTEYPEFQRLDGTYRLSRKDIEDKKEFPEAFITIRDNSRIYLPDSLNSINFPGEVFLASTETVDLPEFRLPFGVLCSKDIENLFMAGPNISVSYFVAGGIRSPRTQVITGEVVGLAASLCLDMNCMPGKLAEKYPKQFHVRLEEGVAEPAFQ